MTIDKAYTELYQKRQDKRAYPNEFAIRTFLGAYPTLPDAFRNVESYRGKTILDLGCGDGRNMPLFDACDMRIFGTEVSQEARDAVTRRMESIGIQCDVRVGRSNNLPFSDSFFDFIFASGVLSFVDRGDTFANNLPEPHRVLRHDGYFAVYLLAATASQLKGAADLGGGHYEIRTDPFGRVNGSIVRAFATRDEIRAELREHFKVEAIGSSEVDVYGFVGINVWWLVCSPVR